MASVISSVEGSSVHLRWARRPQTDRDLRCRFNTLALCRGLCGLTCDLASSEARGHVPSTSVPLTQDSTDLCTSGHIRCFHRLHQSIPASLGQLRNLAAWAILTACVANSFTLNCAEILRNDSSKSGISCREPLQNRSRLQLSTSKASCLFSPHRGSFPPHLGNAMRPISPDIPPYIYRIMFTNYHHRSKQAVHCDCNELAIVRTANINNPQTTDT